MCIRDSDNYGSWYHKKRCEIVEGEEGKDYRIVDREGWSLYEPGAKDIPWNPGHYDSGTKIAEAEVFRGREIKIKCTMEWEEQRWSIGPDSTTDVDKGKKEVLFVVKKWGDGKVDISVSTDGPEIFVG